MILLLLDGSAKKGNFDHAEVLSIAGTEDEVWRQAPSSGRNADAIWYDFKTRKLRWDLPPASGIQRNLPSQSAIQETSARQTEEVKRKCG
jgi:hypothetical protein